MTREAALQAWDLLAEELVVGLGLHATLAQIQDATDAWHALAIDTLAGEPAAWIAAAVVDGLLDRFGGYTSTERHARRARPDPRRPGRRPDGPGADCSRRAARLR
ncbi:MAG: hypothetical protein R2734_19735 [Nocardioides sp.]